MIFRNATAQNLRNPDLIPIIGPLFYESEQGINLILSAIESIDTASITGTVNIDLILSALEAVDSSNITADNLITAYLEESENLDTVLLEAKAILAVSLSEIEDTDNVDITAFSDVDRNAEILSTERNDSVRVIIHNKVIGKTRTYIPYSRIGRAYYQHLTLKFSQKKNQTK